MAKHLIPVFALVFLAACSSGPSSTDVNGLFKDKGSALEEKAEVPVDKSAPTVSQSAAEAAPPAPQTPPPEVTPPPAPVAEKAPATGITSAELFESPENKLFIRVVLNGYLTLSDQTDPLDFSLDGGPKITDALSFPSSLDPKVRSKEDQDDFLLTFEGKMENGGQYTLSHPTLGTPVKVGKTDLLPKNTPSLSPEVKAKLPQPVLPGHQDWIDLYWAAWTFMYDKIAKGNPDNGFAPLYIDEGFNENIYQWDSCFMVNYALYALKVFPVMATLDNFYNHQTEDGYICRTYNERTGLATGEADINPPLFAWTEWRYTQVSGDKSRLAKVLPVLDKYFQWIKRNARGENGQGLYYITNFGSGMDNSPREEDVGQGAWVDISSQQALAALYIEKLARLQGDVIMAENYAKEYQNLKDEINAILWDKSTNTYRDVWEDKSFHPRLTIASFWPLLAQIPDQSRAQSLINDHLKNPKEFYRPHLFPTLSAAEPEYNPDGRYWQGGVWAPTNFAVIKGLSLYDRAFAFEASVNHLTNMAKVYKDFDPAIDPRKMPTIDEKNISRNGDGHQQIWESYSPERPAPGTRWDGRLLTRQKFCGWSGIGPVALLLEEVLGLTVLGSEMKVQWAPRLPEIQGIKNLALGNETVNLSYNPKTQTIEGDCSWPFTLVFTHPETARVFEIKLKAGKFLLPLNQGK